MDFMPAVDIECTNDPIRVSFCDTSWTENAELGSENHSPAFNGDKGSQQHPGMLRFSSSTFFNQPV